MVSSGDGTLNPELGLDKEALITVSLATVEAHTESKLQVMPLEGGTVGCCERSSTC